MRDHGLQVGWEIDDANGVKWASLGTDTASDAETFGNKGNTRVGRDFNAELARFDDRARLFAFLTTFLDQISSRR